METATLLVVGLQLVALGLFVALIYPWVKQEEWKKKFWDNPHARALLIVFVLIAIFIALFKLALHWLVPIEVLP